MAQHSTQTGYMRRWGVLIPVVQARGDAPGVGVMQNDGPSVLVWEEFGTYHYLWPWGS